MKIKSLLAKPFASYIYKGIKKGMVTAAQDQENILKDLLKTGRITDFGKEHGFNNVQAYEEFKNAVPIRDYEQFKGYIDKIKGGKAQCAVEGPTNLFC